MSLAFLVVSGCVGVAGSWGYAPLAGWDAAALVFLSWLWLTLPRLDAAQTRSHATREDPGRGATDVILVSAAVASLASVGFVLVRASSAAGARQDLLAGLAVSSVALSWMVVHTRFALRYACLYFAGPGRPIDFKQDAEARYVDFFYLAFTIGMTFQVSDTDLHASTMRATALRHALLSYLLGAVVIAATINLVVSLGSSSS
jgi:uncharacterized membrane protein